MELFPQEQREEEEEEEEEDRHEVGVQTHGDLSRGGAKCVKQRRLLCSRSAGRVWWWRGTARWWDSTVRDPSSTRDRPPSSYMAPAWLTVSCISRGDPAPPASR